jgi:hypothetical protein
MPVTEAVPDETQALKYKLITLPKQTTNIPVVNVGNTSIILNAPGDSAVIAPNTSNFQGGNANLGYTAILSDSTVADLQVTVLVTPNYLSSAALPAHHKQRLRNIILKHIDTLGEISLAKQWQDVLSYMMNNDYTHLLTDFVQRTRVLDTHRNESFVDVFPEFKDLIC